MCSKYEMYKNKYPLNGLILQGCHQNLKFPFWDKGPLITLSENAFKAIEHILSLLNYFLKDL